MFRLLVCLCSLAILMMIPVLSFADDFQKAQRQLLEASNINAWKLLEADPGNKQPSSSPEFAPIVDDKNSADFSNDQPDDFNPLESVPPQQIPEPASMILVGIGLIGLSVRRKFSR